MKKGNIEMALFTGVFVGIVTFFIEYLTPDISFTFRIIIIALSAIIGGLIGSKLFSNIEEKEQ